VRHFATKCLLHQLFRHQGILDHIVQ
jgi:hypothetical protein